MQKSFIALVVSLIFLQVVIAYNNGVGRTPPMGWNHWNAYHCDIDEDKIKGAADAIVRLGLDKLGYQYINIDDCWAKGRYSNGTVYPDPKTFPSGMKALGDYIHSKGLKFGIYSDAGNETCKERPGSLGHEKQDADTYTEWGVDFLKYDNCYNQKKPIIERYKNMSAALNQTGRPIFFSLCEWGLELPTKWAHNYGQSWRVYADITDKWFSVRQIIEIMAIFSNASAPYGWNDPDMLEVGNGGMNEYQYIAHFAFWCFWKAPLLIGTNLDEIGPRDLAILKKSELIAINQDPLGIPATRVKAGLWGSIWSCRVQNGTAVLIFNGSIQKRNITLNFSDVNIQGSVKIRDLVDERDLGIHKESFSSDFRYDSVLALLLQEESEEMGREQQLQSNNNNEQQFLSKDNREVLEKIVI